MPPKRTKTARFTTKCKQFKLLLEMVKNNEIDHTEQPCTIYYEHALKFAPFNLEQFRNALKKVKEQLGYKPKTGKVDCCIVMMKKK